MRRLLLILLLIILTAYPLTAILNVGGERYYDIIASIIYLLLPAMVIIGAIVLTKNLSIKSTHGKSFLFIFFGFLCFFIGEFIWFIFDYFLGIDPFPSVADFFFLLAYPFLFIGLYKEILLVDIKLSWKKLIFIMLISLLLIFLVGYFGIYAAWDNEASLTENIVAISYGIGDIILICAIIFILELILEYKKGKLFNVWLLLISGFIFMLIADIFFAIYRSEYEELKYIMITVDTLWMIAYFLMAHSLFCYLFIIKEKQKEIIRKMSID